MPYIFVRMFCSYKWCYAIIFQTKMCRIHAAHEIYQLIFLKYTLKVNEVYRGKND
jgi:hypothetical protein